MISHLATFVAGGTFGLLVAAFCVAAADRDER